MLVEQRDYCMLILGYSYGASRLRVTVNVHAFPWLLNEQPNFKRQYMTYNVCI
jgi:hypothetical protein